MLLNAFTLVHVALSLVGIGSGFIMIFGMLASKRQASWINLFLWTTVATSVSGFLFPFHGFTPGIAVGIISIIVLAIAVYAFRSKKLAGGWGRTFVITAVLAQYLNVFVLVVQLFEKTPALMALAPTQSEPPFQMAQLAVLVLFVALGFLTARRFRTA